MEMVTTMLFDYLGRRTLYSPDALAIIDAGKTPERRFTYRELNDRANRLAHWLRDTAGIGKGDRVAILARDGVEHLDCFYACCKLGAVHTALNWRMHWKELDEVIRQTSPKVILFSDDFTNAVIELCNPARADATILSHCIHLEGQGIDGSVLLDKVLAQRISTPVVCEDLCAEDTAALLFTGGTTGTPKGAMISHRMINWNTLNTVVHDITHGDVYLNVFPLFHTGGLFTYTATQITFGGTTILMRQFEPERVLALIEREKVTVFAGVPTMYQMLTQAKNWDAADLRSLRFCTSGGAPLPVTLIEKYMNEKGIRFKQGFGMTEFGPGVFALSPDDAQRKAGSIGRPNFFVDVKVVDDDNRALGANAVGELLLKGPSMCSGYFHDPAASAESVDSAGWLHTGDLVRYDDEFFFFVIGRKKDMFISGGENVFPVEIESVLYKHPAVHMCAVIGVPDERWGEAGKACVVLKAGTTATSEELIGFLKGNLAQYKVPKSVEILDALPLSGMGKIQKSDLKKKILMEQGRPA